MKYSKLFAAVAMVSTFLLADCSKNNPTPAGGCSFTFKSTTIKLASSICGPSQAGQTISSVNATSSQLLTLSKGAGADGIVWASNVADPTNSTYESYSSGVTPSITNSGKNWTFSGTVKNSTTGDKGAISGTCTCTN